MHLTLHLTRSCNMRCSYCYAPPRPDEGMSLDTAKRAMEMAAEANQGKSTGLVFFGGEPLLKRDLIEQIVEHGKDMTRAGRATFHYKITTNGLLLDDDFLRFSLQNDVLIALSFDGAAESHDMHRRLADGSPTWETVIERVKSLLRARPYSSILVCVNPDTAGRLSESIGLLMDLGVRYMIVSLNYAAEWTERDFRTLKREYKKLGDLYIEWTMAGRKFYLSPFEVKLSSHINRHCYQKERCELGQKQISVAPDGSLYPCVQFTRAGRESDWCIGHVDTGIDEDARARLFAASQAEKDVCRGCAIVERCNNTCGCLNWQTTGSINEISPVLCRHEQMLMPVADRVGEYLYKKRDPLFLHKHYNSAYPVISLIEDTLGESGKDL